jgi:hypothetical protein
VLTTQVPLKEPWDFPAVAYDTYIVLNRLCIANTFFFFPASLRSASSCNNNGDIWRKSAQLPERVTVRSVDCMMIVCCSFDRRCLAVTRDRLISPPMAPEHPVDNRAMMRCNPFREVEMTLCVVARDARRVWKLGDMTPC